MKRAARKPARNKASSSRPKLLPKKQPLSPFPNNSRASLNDSSSLDAPPPQQRHAEVRRCLKARHLTSTLPSSQQRSPSESQRGSTLLPTKQVSIPAHFMRTQQAVRAPASQALYTAESPVAARQHGGPGYQRRSLLDDHCEVVFPLSMQQQEQQKTFSTGEFIDAEELEISCDMRRRLYDGTGGSSATRGPRRLPGTPIQYEAVRTSAIHHQPQHHNKQQRRGSGVTSLNSFYSKRNTGNYLPPPSEQELEALRYSPAAYYSQERQSGLLSGSSSLAEMAAQFEEPRVVGTGFYPEFSSSMEDAAGLGAAAHWSRSRKTIADLSIPEEAAGENYSNLPSKKHAKLKKEASKRPQRAGAPSPRAFQFERKSKSKSALGRRSYVNEQLSNDIKRTQDRLNRLLHKSAARSKPAGHGGGFFSPQTGLDSEASQKSRVSSVEPTPAFLLARTKTGSSSGSSYSRPFAKNMQKLRSATIAMNNWQQPFQSTRQARLTPPLHSHNNSESSFMRGLHAASTASLSTTTKPKAQQQTATTTNFFSPTYASKQKAKPPQRTRAVRTEDFSLEEEMYSNFHPPRLENSVVTECIKNPFSQVTAAAYASQHTGESDVYEYTAKKPRCGRTSGLTISPPPPVEPMVSENYSDEEPSTSFSPPQQQQRRDLSLARSLEPDAFSPMARLAQKLAPATTKHSRSITAFSQEKLVKIKEIFNRFKRENDRIGGVFSAQQRSRCLSSDERVMNTSAPQQAVSPVAAIQQRALFRNSGPRSPEKASIAGMWRKKKTRSVAPSSSGLMSIPKFLSVSLQEDEDEKATKIVDNGLAEIPVKLKPVVPRLQLSKLTVTDSSRSNSGILVVEGLDLDVSEAGAGGGAVGGGKDAVQSYVESQQRNARLLGVILKGIVVRRLSKWFELFQLQLEPIPASRLCDVSVGVSYLLSSRAYQRVFARLVGRKQKAWERWRRVGEGRRASQRAALNYSPRGEGGGGLFRISGEWGATAGCSLSRLQASPMFKQPLDD